MSGIDTVIGLLGRDGLRFGEPQRAGSLTVVPVFHDGETAVYRLFTEVRGSGVVEVGEVGGGSVPDLQVVNRSGQAVLLVVGEVLGGLRQTRTLNTTVLVPAHAVVTVPVACVEAGRWGAARPLNREAFHASPRVRHSKNVGIEARAAMGGGFYAEQGRVWTAVDEDLALHGVASPTRSHAEAHRWRAGDIESLTARLRPVEGQRGVLALVGQRPVALDLFDRPETLAALWSALVGSYAADALLASGTADDGQVAGAVAAVGLLAAGRSGAHPAVGEGEVVLVSAREAVVCALVVGAAVVHLAAVWPPAGAEAPPEVRFSRPGRRGSWFGGTR
jgi:hypothetical protein